RHAHRAVREAGLDERIRLHRAHLPDHGLHEQHYHAVISNSLLHHLPDPKTLWASIRTLGRPGAVVTVMDLERPDTQQAARDIITREASDAPAVLQEDFYNSLLAAYTVEEVHRQLESAGLDTFEIIRPSDRHWLVRGRLPD
ncbi:MAG: hypothetical protein R3348_08360, partial [Xanthomonadales bacterium]|nr:hypothetical protein [Xanthomonadales bacterium]